MSKNENQEENLDQRTKKESQQSPINKGDEFMLKRRKRRRLTAEEPKEVQPKEEGSKMNLAVVLVFSTLITIGGTLLGFIIGWFAHAYYVGFVEQVQEALTADEEEVSFTPHPEMMDEEGNTIPFHVAKLISVEFDQRDAFDSDPFADDD